MDYQKQLDKLYKHHILLERVRLLFWISFVVFFFSLISPIKFVLLKTSHQIVMEATGEFWWTIFAWIYKRLFFTVSFYFFILTFISGIIYYIVDIKYLKKINPNHPIFKKSDRIDQEYKKKLKKIKIKSDKRHKKKALIYYVKVECVFIIFGIFFTFLYYWILINNSSESNIKILNILYPIIILLYIGILMELINIIKCIYKKYINYIVTKKK